MPTPDKSIKDFEKSLHSLEQIVQKLESSDGNEPGLEESLKQFEKGIALAKNCQHALSSAELKVKQLIEQNGLQQTLPFDDEDV